MSHQNITARILESKDMGLQIIDNHIREHLRVVSDFSKLLPQDLYEISALISDSLGQGGTVFLCGNGGSASDSQHISAELVGRFSRNRRPLRAIALTTDTSILTCISNDFSYDNVFSRQLEALARPKDVLLAITTSGNSPNIVNAVKAAQLNDVSTVGLLGNDGGLIKSMVNYSLVVPSHSTTRIQEVHILIGHILCDMIEKNLGLS